MSLSFANISAKIIAIFSRAVLYALTQKLFLYCNSELKKFTQKIKLKYQKFIATIGFASCMVWLLNPYANNFVKNPLKICTTMLNKIRNVKNMINIHTLIRPFRFALIKVGRKL